MQVDEITGSFRNDGISTGRAKDQKDTYYVWVVW